MIKYADFPSYFKQTGFCHKTDPHRAFPFAAALPASCPYPVGRRSIPCKALPWGPWLLRRSLPRTSGRIWAIKGRLEILFGFHLELASGLRGAFFFGTALVSATKAFLAWNSRRHLFWLGLFHIVFCRYSIRAYFWMNLESFFRGSAHRFS